MKIKLKLKQQGMPVELGYYFCKHKDSGIKALVEIQLHPEDKVPVIFQIGTPRVFTQDKKDKGFFWSECLEFV